MQTDGMIPLLHRTAINTLSDMLDAEYVMFTRHRGVFSRRSVGLFIGSLLGTIVLLFLSMASPAIQTAESFTVDTSQIDFDTSGYITEKRYTEFDDGYDLDPVHTYTWKYSSDMFSSPILMYSGYRDTEITMTIEYPVEWYKGYRAIQFWVSKWFDDVDELITVDDPYLMAIADRFMEITKDMDSYHRADFVLKFVQSIPYEEDSYKYRYSDYWKFPAETLWDNSGDCEDKAFLFITLIRIMGYDAIPLFVEIETPFSHEYHVAAGIVMDDTFGYAYEVDGKEYIYCECTTKYGSYPIGIKPFFYYVHEWNKNSLLKGYLRI